MKRVLSFLLIAASVLLAAAGCKTCCHDVATVSTVRPGAIVAPPATAASTPAPAAVPLAAPSQPRPATIRINAGGGARAYVETVPVDITTGRLEFKFTPQVENPQINAIEITPVP